MAFRFKQFSVEDTRSTMRVGTDAMILGAWAEPPKQGFILDIGTGCGILALMMAQKSKARIDAIDIDHPSCREATLNFKNSPWNDRLSTIHTSIQLLAATTSFRYDYIITNPPFFENQLKSPSIRKNQSRHDQELTLAELISQIASLLTDQGRFALILPPGRILKLQELSMKQGVFPLRQLTVQSRPGKGPKRILLEFGRTGTGKTGHASLTILGTDGKYTPGYLYLTNSFHYL